jgi:transcriptional regulator with XRE-family HTH domain
MSEHLAEANVPRWDLADRLRKALREAGISVQEMAEYLEISRNTVGSWINGHHRPRPSDLKQWALRTGVSYPWLTYGELPRGDSNSQPAGLVKDHRPFGAAEKLAMRKVLPIRLPNDSLHKVHP